MNIKKVKIGSSYYDVDYVDELEVDGRTLFGRILEVYRQIKVCTNGTEQNQLQTLLHESLHGIMWEYDVKDAEEDVLKLSNGIYALIVDNPKFIQKILDYTKKIKK